jgi:hypothetical protein
VFGPGLTRAGIEQIAANNSGLQASPEFSELFENCHYITPVAPALLRSG